MNEKIMRTMLNDRSKTQMGRILASEYLSVAVAGIVLFTFLTRINHTAEVLVPYWISIFFFAISLGWSYYKIRYIAQTDIGNSPVTKSLRRLSKLRLMIAKEKLVLFALTPVLVLSLMPVLDKWIFNINVFENIWNFMPRIVIACVAIVLVCIWVYKKVYFKNIAAMMANLEELRAFEKEDQPAEG